MKGLDEKITDELVAGILNVMEEKVIKIVLYASVVRGTDTEESDVDVALLLTKSMDKDEEERASIMEQYNENAKAGSAKAEAIKAREDVLEESYSRYIAS